MNLVIKCNCCIKEDVCSIKEEYLRQIKDIKQAIHNENIEYSIKCKKFNSQTLTR